MKHLLGKSGQLLPEAKHTGLWAVLSVCVSVSFGTRGVWNPADVTFGKMTIGILLTYNTYRGTLKLMSNSKYDLIIPKGYT